MGRAPRRESPVFVLLRVPVHDVLSVISPPNTSIPFFIAQKSPHMEQDCSDSGDRWRRICRATRGNSRCCSRSSQRRSLRARAAPFSFSRRSGYLARSPIRTASQVALIPVQDLARQAKIGQSLRGCKSREDNFLWAVNRAIGPPKWLFPDK